MAFILTMIVERYSYRLGEILGMNLVFPFIWGGFLILIEIACEVLENDEEDET